MPAESTDFYSTAAQVLPVLYLAIVFEQGIWRGTARESSKVFGIETGTLPQGKFATAIGALIVLLIGNLFVGEWFALASIGGEESEVARHFVTSALVLGGIVVVLPPLWIALPALLPAAALRSELDMKLARAVIVVLAVAAAVSSLVGIVLAVL
jgi:hypothetical protein